MDIINVEVMCMMIQERYLDCLDKCQTLLRRARDLGDLADNYIYCELKDIQHRLWDLKDLIDQDERKAASMIENCFKDLDSLHVMINCN